MEPNNRGRVTKRKMSKQGDQVWQGNREMISLQPLKTGQLQPLKTGQNVEQ